MKLLKAPEPDAPEFVLMRLKMLKYFCTYYSWDSQESFIGPEEECEVVVFINRDNEKPTGEIPWAETNERPLIDTE